MVGTMRRRTRIALFATIAIATVAAAIPTSEFGLHEWRWHESMRPAAMIADPAENADVARLLRLTGPVDVTGVVVLAPQPARTALTGGIPAPSPPSGVAARIAGRFNPASCSSHLEEVTGYALTASVRADRTGPADPPLAADPGTSMPGPYVPGAEYRVIKRARLDTVNGVSTYQPMTSAPANWGPTQPGEVAEGASAANLGVIALPFSGPGGIGDLCTLLSNVARETSITSPAAAGHSLRLELDPARADDRLLHDQLLDARAHGEPMTRSDVADQRVFLDGTVWTRGFRITATTGADGARVLTIGTDTKTATLTFTPARP